MGFAKPIQFKMAQEKSDLGSVVVNRCKAKETNVETILVGIAAPATPNDGCWDHTEYSKPYLSARKDYGW